MLNPCDYFGRATNAVFYMTITVSLLTIVVNPMTMLAMIQGRLLDRSATYQLIFSLCMSDLLLGLGNLLWKYHGLVSQPQPPELSWIAALLTMLGFLSSTINILLIGIDRTLAAAASVRYKGLVTLRVSRMVLLSTWGISLVINALPIGLKLWHNNFEHGQLSPVFHIQEPYPSAFVTYFLLPLVFWMVACTCLLYAYVLSSYLLARVPSSGSGGRQRVTRMILMVVAFSVSFNVPLVVVGSKWHPEEVASSTLRQLIFESSCFLSVIPTFCNNFLYASHLKDFRQAHQILFRCRKFSNHIVPFQPSRTQSNWQPCGISRPTPALCFAWIASHVWDTVTFPWLQGYWRVVLGLCPLPIWGK